MQGDQPVKVQAVANPKDGKPGQRHEPPPPGSSHCGADQCREGRNQHEETRQGACGIGSLRKRQLGHRAEIIGAQPRKEEAAQQCPAPGGPGEVAQQQPKPLDDRGDYRGPERDGRVAHPCQREPAGQADLPNPVIALNHADIAEIHERQPAERHDRHEHLLRHEVGHHHRRKPPCQRADPGQPAGARGAPDKEDVGEHDRLHERQNQCQVLHAQGRQTPESQHIEKDGEVRKIRGGTNRVDRAVPLEFALADKDRPMAVTRLLQGVDHRVPVPARIEAACEMHGQKMGRGPAHGSRERHDPERLGPGITAGIGVSARDPAQPGDKERGGRRPIYERARSAGRPAKQAAHGDPDASRHQPIGQDSGHMSDGVRQSLVSLAKTHQFFKVAEIPRDARSRSADAGGWRRMSAIGIPRARPASRAARPM